MNRVRPSNALKLHRDEIRRLVLQARAVNPRVFGSVLRGRDTESSDLDILVDPLPGTTLFDLGGLQIALEELLGIQVDLLTPGDLPQRSRERVLNEAVPV
jgi:predicted nucleotidyltransferase